MLEARGQPYVLAVRSNHCLRFLTTAGLLQTDPAQLADELPADAWAPHAAGEGSKGIRLYDWARLALPWTVDDGFECWVLFRRNRRDPQDRAYYLVFAPRGTSVAELAGVAGLRWTVEECFQRAKEELGLDHCEARSWHGWHRHMTLCMAALGFLAKLSAQLRQAAGSKANKGTAIRAAIRAAGAKLFFLPPYSPDLNPIEQAFSKLKTLLRKAAEQTVTATWKRIGTLLDEFTSQECRNYLVNAGYGSA